MRDTLQRSLKILPFILIGLGIGLAIDYNVKPNLTWDNGPRPMVTYVQTTARAETPTSPVVASEDDFTALERSSRVFGDIARRVNPGVVAINTTRKVKSPEGMGGLDEMFNDPWFRRFFRQPEQGEMEQSFLGSGVIVSPDGYILTNNHVVEEGDEILVRLQSDEEEGVTEGHKAKLVGNDPSTDVAVIKIEGKNLPTVKLGDSDRLNVGDWVVAVGNPFGLTHTVTAGIVSALGRTRILGTDSYEDFIQTDAAINPGNSGGALVNVRGELIGIPTAIATGNARQFAGAGFAIPVNMAKNVMEQLIEHGRVVRGWLGVSIQDVDQETAEAMGLKDVRGVLITSIIGDDSPAKAAGIERRDVVISVDGKKTPNVNTLRNVIAGIKPGSKVEMKVIRDGKELTFKPKIAEKPADEELDRFRGDEEETKEDVLGLSVSNITDEVIERFRDYKGEEGVIIRDVKQGSPGDRANLRPGHLIKEMIIASRTYTIRNVEDYHDAVGRLNAGDSVVLWVKDPGGREFYVSTRIPKEKE
jgi:serine protease Do